MVTAETTVTRETRTMFAADPQPASGPTDPSLPVSHLFASHLRAVGVCVPASPVIKPTTELLQVVLWQVSADGSARIIDRPQLLYSNLYDVGEAYYAPPETEGEYWPAGRYVFEIKRQAQGESGWMALEFTPTA